MRLPYNWFHRIALLLSTLIVLGMLGFLALRYNTLPEQIPTHFNFAGEPNAWGGRSAAWLLPLISLAMLLTLLPVIHFPRSWNLPGKVNERNRRFLYMQTKHFLCALTLGINVMFSYLFLSTVLAMPLHGAFLPIFLFVCVAGPMIWLLLIFVRARRL